MTISLTIPHGFGCGSLTKHWSEASRGLWAVYISYRLSENNDLIRKGSGKEAFFPLVRNALMLGWITRHPQSSVSPSYFWTPGLLQIGNITKIQFKWEKTLRTNIPSLRYIYWLSGRSEETGIIVLCVRVNHLIPVIKTQGPAPILRY